MVWATGKHQVQLKTTTEKPLVVYVVNSICTLVQLFARISPVDPTRHARPAALCSLPGWQHRRFVGQEHQGEPQGPAAASWIRVQGSVVQFPALCADNSTAALRPILTMLRLHIHVRCRHASGSRPCRTALHSIAQRQPQAAVASQPGCRTGQALAQRTTATATTGPVRSSRRKGQHLPA